MARLDLNPDFYTDLLFLLANYDLFYSFMFYILSTLFRTDPPFLGGLRFMPAGTCSQVGEPQA
ncbi:hypothetical protein RND71_021887 [Anisodus tanguticus]|uniref:Uncharacterized protein n=1 Tax=Anisodus tanguticus TaxID=243964 RepID=A0AAE1RYX1_9SOLA|nr:hypothetical protein RND71_021887 [Anisodus tanguticus]